MDIATSVKQMSDIVGETMVRHTFKKLARIELEKCMRNMDRLKMDLNPFEKRFNKSSREAWAEYQRGDMGDDGDVMEWMMLFENYRALQNQCERINAVEFK